MKILSILFFFCSISVFGQNKEAEKVIHKFRVQFNGAKYEDIYKTLSDEYKQKISQETLSKYLTNIHGMIGGFRSSELKYSDKKTFNFFFVCNNKEINADFQCVLDSNGKFDYLSFKRIGGSSNPPPIGKLK